MPTLKLNYYEVNIGNSFLVPAYAAGHFFAQQGNYGIALFGTFLSEIVFEILKYEKQLGMTLPKIFGIPLHSAFSDPVQSPMFNRISISGPEYAASYIGLMKYFKWTVSNWLVNNITDITDIRDSFSIYGEQQSIKVAN